MSKNFRMLGLSANLVLLAMATVPYVLAQEPITITRFALGQDTKQALIQQPAEMSQLPQHIWHAAIAAVGNIKATKSAVEVAADGTVLYVLDFQTENGRKVSVDIASSGQVKAVEFTMTIGELPQQVAATLRRWAPSLDASEIEKSVRPGGVVVYELVGRDGQGEFYAEIPEDGRGIVIVANQATEIALRGNR